MTYEQAIEVLIDMKGLFNKRSHNQYYLPVLELAIQALANFRNCKDCSFCSETGYCENFEIYVTSETDGCSFYKDV